MKAVAYCRYSSDNQREESIEAQARAIKEYAEKNNIEIIKIYADEAKSATTDDRPQFLQMIKDSEMNIFQAVIVHKLDRFARNRYDSAFYKRLLKKNGVRLISVLEQLDDSPESIILESVLEGMAEYYSRNLAREVMKGLKENAFQARFNGGIPPFGYDIINGHYVINEKEAEAVRLIFKMYNDGYGYRHIIDELNLHGYKTKKGNTFSKNSLHDILKNEKYIGKYIFNKGTKYKHNICKEDVIIIDNAIPAIIDKDLFEEVQKKMEKAKRTQAAHNVKRIYLLSGLIECGICGASMTGCLGKQKYTYYRCNNKQRTKQCDNKDINQDMIENYILSELQEKIFNDDIIPQIAKSLNKENQEIISDRQNMQKTLLKRKEEIDKSISTIVDAIAAGHFHPSLDAKLTELEQQKNEVEIRLRELELKPDVSIITEDMITAYLIKDKDILTKGDRKKIKAMLPTYIKKITVYHDKVEAILKISINQKVCTWMVAASGVEPPTLRV
ncbi:recombinase family protein [Thermoanaerobacterium sp. RBIITD]|uniref:recombinase family protein n=1 Tax=Thermoanaerobacterium sp. RBIITD TaxID=1550240 RepID=UPI000BB703B5|nr:recombinase family protein [Thermoanaerobacterium sp. RBIITD]SNX54039.1 site-specific DNA recombinase [Thermoanaerobacterium sp. RBIITD]